MSKGVIAVIIFGALLAVVAVYLNFAARPDFGPQGGVRIGVEAESRLPEGRELSSDEFDAIVTSLAQRLSAMKVGPTRVTGGERNLIYIEMPASGDRRRILERLLRPGNLEFRHLRSVKSNRHPQAKYQMDIEADEQGRDVYTFTTADGQTVKHETVLMESPVVLTAADLKPTAKAQKMSQPPNQIHIAIEFNREGTTKLADFTRRNVGEYLAIILDGRILSASVIRTPILDGKAVIEGGFKTVEEASELANSLNLGSLPVTLKVVSEERIR